MSTIQPSANCADAAPISLATVYSTPLRQSIPAGGGWTSFDCQTNTFIGGYISVSGGSQVQIEWYFGCDNLQGSATISGTQNWNPSSGKPTGTPAFKISSGNYAGPVFLRVVTPAGGNVSLYLK